MSSGLNLTLYAVSVGSVGSRRWCAHSATSHTTWRAPRCTCTHLATMGGGDELFLVLDVVGIAGVVGIGGALSI